MPANTDEVTSSLKSLKLSTAQQSKTKAKTDSLADSWEDEPISGSGSDTETEELSSPSSGTKPL
ncbi:hypothetical protein LTS18_013174, partial [Coniosporium uncinatum]